MSTLRKWSVLADKLVKGFLGEGLVLITRLGRSTPSLALPRCADPGQTSWTRVGEAGAKVSIPRTAVSLTVPKGAIEPGRLEDVFICLTSPSSSLAAPVLEQDQVLITPVVVVGPLHLTAHLKKPVVVSIPHCGGPGLSQVLYPLLPPLLH